jgi:pyruvyl transferase EpsO
MLAPLVEGVDRWALLGYPDHANVGDSAIWIGELRLLRRILGRSPSYVCDSGSYSRDALARSLPRGPILISGGGNFGDLWTAEQELRERALRDFPDRPIVQLPQSMQFTSAARLDRARAVVDAHPSLTLLARDSRSLDAMRCAFRARSLLCPDAAFGLGVLDRTTPASREIVWQSREDLEALEPPYRGSVLEPGDWLAEHPTAAQRAARLALRASARLAGGFGPAAAFVPALCGTAARQRVSRGCAWLCAGRLVVTNRLHGHILCLLLGIPHFISDNRYGKLRAFFDDWTRESPLVTWCDSEEEAVTRAERAARSPT